MKWNLRIGLFWALACIMAACSTETESLKPSFTGSSGELLIICSDAEWQSELGDSIRQWLQPNFPMLPQQEAMFSLVHFESMELNDLLRRHRNILHIDITPDSKKPFFRLGKERYSKDQMYFWLQTSTRSEALALIDANRERIISMLRTAERNRLADRYRKVPWEKTDDIVGKSFGVNLVLPKDCELIKQKTDFLWFKRERKKMMGQGSHYVYEGIVLYRYPYTSDTLLELESLIATRNRILGEEIPGPVDSSGMSTQDFIPPVAVTTQIDGQYAVELRGMWRTTRSFLGGPFVSLSIVSPDNSEIITAEGFVMAPKFDKREFVKEVEAMVYSLQFLPDSSAVNAGNAAKSGA